MSLARSLDWTLAPSALAECNACDITSRRADGVPEVPAGGEGGEPSDRPPRQKRAEVLLCAALTHYRHPAAPAGASRRESGALPRAAR